MPRECRTGVGKRIADTAAFVESGAMARDGGGFANGIVDCFPDGILTEAQVGAGVSISAARSDRMQDNDSFNEPRARSRVGVDVGGTFTDVVLNEDGAVRTAKVPSVPEDPSRGFFSGLERILERTKAGHESIDLLLHGSTVATNAILEGRGARTGMLVTDGFKYVLEIGRAEIPRRANLFAWVKPKRPVPPRLILEVPERMRLDGGVERELDEDRCRAAARELGAAGVDAVAVVFLHAWANPAHERRAGELVRAELPAAAVSLSSDVLPVFREYERSMATVLNARVQPLVGRYVERVASGLEARGVEAPLFVMKSNGGMYSPREAIREPVHMALSGPAAGVRGAAFVGSAAGYRDLIAIDMGGTSADVCLVRDAAPAITKDGEIGPFPLPIPMVDIHTIGAGGGSIASVTVDASLVVGPRSAGADPGPAGYGRGGDEPTVTDANLVLGRIPPSLLDGEIALDPARSEAALRERVAKPLGIGVEEAARGVLAIVNNNMVGALRVVSVERGFDPRAFSLCAFGGAGPVHGGDLARELGAPRLLVPRHPGILCALGLLATDLRYDFVRTRVQRAPDYDIDGIARTMHQLEEEATARLAGERIDAPRRELRRAADLRYAQQGVEITVDFPDGPIDAGCVAALVEGFHALHERLYTFADREAAVEIVNFRVAATGRMERLDLPRLASARPGTEAPPSGRRRADLDGGGLAQVPTHRREDLRAGHVVTGPAIVDQLDSTTLVGPGRSAAVDLHGNLIVTQA